MNGLDGLIPWGIGPLPALKILILSDNKLSGSIPSCFSSSWALSHLDLRNNELSGRFTSLALSLQYLSLTWNWLVGRLGDIQQIDLLGLQLWSIYRCHTEFALHFPIVILDAQPELNVRQSDQCHSTHHYQLQPFSPFLSGAQSLHFLTTSSSQCHTWGELQLFTNHHDRALPQKSFH